MTEPTIVYDDDCGFCTWWAERIAERSDVRLVGFSELTDDLLALLPVDYEECAHLLVDGAVYSCGAAIEEAILRTDEGDQLRPVAEFLQQFDEYDRVREAAYRLAADNRDVLGRLVSSPPPARSTDE